LTVGYSIVDDPLMAKNVSVVITDDLDGEAGAKTVTFGFDGVSYEIDLATANRDKLEKALAPFIGAARRARAGTRRGASRPAAPSVDRAAVRAWAREAGLNVSDRGRISAEIMSQYDATH
jgi:Lsr2